MSLTRFIKEANGEFIPRNPDVVEVKLEKPLEDKLGDIQEHFENYTGAIADLIMTLKEDGLNDEPFKDGIDQLVELHETLKNDLWNTVKNK